ncbi:hypothetical protein, partial [Desulfoprunum benzoelyticum]|uniref:hypothetical protein n=1 Tax=Desulfoprunum benzoelyticum TaxID=1506996 RepID=UPI001962A30D
ASCSAPGYVAVFLRSHALQGKGGVQPCSDLPENFGPLNSGSSSFEVELTELNQEDCHASRRNLVHPLKA